MHPEVERRLLALEERKNALIERAKALPPSQQNASPGKGEMTPAGVIMHMGLAEEMHNGLLTVHPPSTVKDSKPFRGLFYNGAIKSMSGLRKRPPMLPHFKPKDVLLLDEAIHEWNIHRREIARHLSGVSDPKRAFIKFPFVFGTLSADDYLTLLEVHTKYHEHFFPKATAFSS